MKYVPCNECIGDEWMAQNITNTGSCRKIPNWCYQCLLKDNKVNARQGCKKWKHCLPDHPVALILHKLLALPGTWKQWIWSHHHHHHKHHCHHHHHHHRLWVIVLEQSYLLPSGGQVFFLGGNYQLWYYNNIIDIKIIIIVIKIILIKIKIMITIIIIIIKIIWSNHSWEGSRVFRDQNLHELLSPSGRCACHGHYQQVLDYHDYHH